MSASLCLDGLGGEEGEMDVMDKVSWYWGSYNTLDDGIARY